MKLGPFKLERYLAEHEHKVKYLLCASDCDGLSQKQLLDMADKETKKLWGSLSLGYTETQGHPRLREEIANLYTNVNPSEVLVLTPEEGILIAFSVLLNKGDHVICTFPGYQSLYEVPRKLGCKVTRWPIEEKNGWRFDPHFLVRNIRKNTKLVIFNFPHNPTGYLPSHSDYEEIINVAKKNDLYIFADEMYYGLERSPKDKIPSTSEVYDKGISLYGMSKAFGLAGLRIAWLVVKEKRLLARIAAYKDYTSFASSAPSEILSIIALRNRKTIIGNHLGRIKKNLEVLDAFFEKHRNLFQWTRPKGGTVAFPKLNAGQDSSEFCRRILNNTGILLIPSTLYNFGSKHFRVGFGRENMPLVLNLFDKYLASTKNTTGGYNLKAVSGET